MNLFFVIIGPIATNGQFVQRDTSCEVSSGQALTACCITLKRLIAVSIKGCQMNTPTAMTIMSGSHLTTKDLASAMRVTTWLEYLEEPVTSCTVWSGSIVAE